MPKCAERAKGEDAQHPFQSLSSHGREVFSLLPQSFRVLHSNCLCNPEANITAWATIRRAERPATLADTAVQPGSTLRASLAWRDPSITTAGGLNSAADNCWLLVLLLDTS